MQEYKRYQLKGCKTVIHSFHFMHKVSNIQRS